MPAMLRHTRDTLIDMLYFHFDQTQDNMRTEKIIFSVDERWENKQICFRGRRCRLV